MTFNPEAARTNLQAFDFKHLFIENLGWDKLLTDLDVTVNNSGYHFTAVAQKSGFAVYLMDCGSEGILPGPLRRKIETEVRKSVHEHILIFIDRAHSIQKWQWVRRESGKPLASREYDFNKIHDGRDLISRLAELYVSLEVEEKHTLGIVDMAGKVKAGFDVERVTRSFYDEFKKEHDILVKFLKYIPDESLQRWYASVTLNRLMFVYFIQKNFHLNNDVDYLKNRLAESPKGKDRFYKDFLCPLFFEGFAKPEGERDPKLKALLGNLPYLNGGIFARHYIEQLHGDVIQIPDEAFDRLFNFFDRYQWHLDDRPLRQGNEINPDVLGYIFEKYINQKEMGAYYTKEDITGYISKSTILPYLLDETRRKCAIAFEGAESVWNLLQANPRRYIYESVQKGVDLPLPDDIAAGIQDVAKRDGWNKPAAEAYSLPTEIWREVVARRHRFEELETRLVSGGVTEVNDLITYNLDIQQFTQDLIESIEGPDLLRAFWKALENIKVLDPTCGSGAFLFAALNILEPLYEACLQRMRIFVDELDESDEKHRPEKFSDFRATLEKVQKHPNQRYFIYKSIIIHNLYGVDIMDEAVEICKLRLFLKLVSEEKIGRRLEALPDIDFNIRAGNTLVGFTSIDEVKNTLLSGEKGKGITFFEKESIDKHINDIEIQAEEISKLFFRFTKIQEDGYDKNAVTVKELIQSKLYELNIELNKALAKAYGIDPLSLEFEVWRKSNKPLHWYTEFYEIIKSGGFSVVIGNPPYIEYSKVRNIYSILNFNTEESGNLYCYVIERSIELLKNSCWIGMIIQMSAFCTPRMITFQDYWFAKINDTMLSFFDDRPGKLFDGLQHIRVAIPIGKKVKGNSNNIKIFTTKYNKFPTEFRNYLFDSLYFQKNDSPRHESSILKVSTKIENSIIEKVWRNKERIALYVQETKNENFVYYGYGFGYWGKVLNFKPFFEGENTNESTGDKYLYILPDHERDIIVAVMNSSLFYWFYENYSDGHNFTKFVIGAFPFCYPSDDKLPTYKSFVEELMNDLKKKAIRKTAFYKATGIVSYDEFSPRNSKKIIDSIDRILSEHYGFTEEELDFILNYDIKYRLGVDSEEE